MRLSQARPVIHSKQASWIDQLVERIADSWGLVGAGNIVANGVAASTYTSAVGSEATMHAVAGLGRLIWRRARWFAVAAHRYEFAEAISESIRVLVQTAQRLPKLLPAGGLASTGSAGRRTAARECPAAAY